jgi:hypothetical protein
MTPIELTDNGLLDNLPLLTQVADEDAPDDLPTLTEVVTDETTGETTSHPTKQPEDGCQVVGYSHSTRLSAEKLLAGHPKDDSRVAGYEGQTEPASGLQPDADREIPAPEAAASCTPNEEEVQRLLRRLETHLENRFAHKLSANLEQLQRQAIDQAVSELKAELPELLRNALNAHPEL